MIILSTHVTMTPNRGMKNFYNTKVDGVKVFKYSDETAEAVASGEKLLKESGTVYESFADMMSPDDAAKYLDFLENGSREGLTSAELAGVEKADALLVSQKVGYEDVWDLRNAGDVLESGSKGGTSILAQYGDDFGKMGTYVANPNIKVDWTQYAEHAAERMQQRGMTQEMVNNIVKNGKVLSQNNGNKFAYITQEGVAIVSKEGKLITAWSSEDFDSSMLEIISKLFGK